MKRLLEGAALFIFFCGYFAYKIFAPDLFDPYLYDICDQSYIDHKIEEAYKRAEQSKKKNQKLQKIKQELIELDVPANKADEYLSISYSYAHLVQNNCPVPSDLETQFFSTLTPEHKSSIICEKNKFLLESKRDLEEAKTSKTYYNTFEKMLYEEIYKNVNNTNLREKLNQQWKQKEFRESLIIASIQSSYREENNCRNVMLPLQSHFKILMKDSLQ